MPFVDHKSREGLPRQDLARSVPNSDTSLGSRLIVGSNLAQTDVLSIPIGTSQLLPIYSQWETRKIDTANEADSPQCQLEDSEGNKPVVPLDRHLNTE